SPPWRRWRAARPWSHATGAAPATSCATEATASSTRARTRERSRTRCPGARPSNSITLSFGPRPFRFAGSDLPRSSKQRWESFGGDSKVLATHRGPARRLGRQRDVPGAARCLLPALPRRDRARHQGRPGRGLLLSAPAPDRGPLAHRLLLLWALPGPAQPLAGGGGPLGAGRHGSRDASGGGPRDAVSRLHVFAA